MSNDSDFSRMARDGEVAAICLARADGELTRAATADALC